MEIDAGRLKDTNLLKRLVMKRCIYGVDLNPMAVELAKLSLWLDSFTLGAPLSFLDHHLRCGNALIGSRVQPVERELKTDLLGSAFGGLLKGTELMQQVADNTDATPSEVEESAARFGEYERAMRPYKRLLDLHTSHHFGNPEGFAHLKDYGAQLRDALKQDAVEDLPEAQQESLAEAERLRREKRFFHWELEFPEVFFDLDAADWKQNPGFDAVVGNPPYGIEYDPSEKQYIEKTFVSFERNNNKYTAFTQKCIELISEGGLTSLIVPNTFILGDYFDNLKELWLEETQTIFIDDFGYEQIFLDPDVFSAIFLCRKEDSESRSEAVLRGASVEAGEITYVEEQTEKLADLPTMKWKPLSDVTKKARSMSIRAGDICYVKDVGFNYWTKGRGKKRGQGSIGDKVLYDGSREHPDDIPYLKGGDFSRYDSPSSKNHWLRHNYTDRLDSEVDTFRFSPEFLRVPKKIVYRQTADEIVAAIDEEGCLVDKTVHVILFRDDDNTYEYEYLLALLNSRLHDFIYGDLSHEEGRAFAQVKTFRVKELPIREIAFETPEDECEAAVEEAVAAYEEAVELVVETFHETSLPWKDATMPVLKQVGEHLSAEPERADVVHDLLAHLAREMTRLHAERQDLDAALDPFKFLDRGAPFVPFTDAFSDAIKYGTPLREAVDPGAAHHDLDGLRLTPTGGDAWTLEVQLKKRDPAADWREWQKNGRSIEREWAPVYRFARGLPEEKARYYQHAFRVIEDFSEAGRFPGGHTRTTQKKLRAAQVPRFNKSADLAPLVELSEERAEVERRIAFTDALIDQIVYRLYALTDEEVALVEA